VKHPQRLRSPNHKSLFFGNNTYAGEFTGDHHPDLVEARQGYASGPKNGLVRKSRVVFMRGTSHGLAKPVKIASTGGTVLVGDVVGSHADDLLIQNDTGIHVLVGHKRGLTKPTLLPNTAGLGRIQGLMDVDRDGHLDALVLGTGPTVDGSPTAALQIVPGTGNGFDVSAAWQIDASTPDAPACIAQGGLAQGSATQERVLTRDVTGDGLPDLLVGAEVNPATEDCPLPELDVFNGGPESLTTSATYYQFPSSDAWYHAV
jgi:hypothetical protein